MNRRGLDPERVAWVQSLLATCPPAGILERKIAAQFDITTRQARRYLVAAREEIRRGNDVDRAERRARLRATLEAVIERGMSAGDMRSVVAAVRESMRLDGADEPTRIEVAGAIAGAAVDFADPIKAREFVRAFLESHPELMPPKPEKP